MTRVFNAFRSSPEDRLFVDIAMSVLTMQREVKRGNDHGGILERLQIAA